MDRTTGAASNHRGVPEPPEMHVIHTIEEVQQRVDHLLERGPRTLVIDVSELVHLSSATIAALMWVRRCCSARGVDMVLRAPSRRLLGTLQRNDLLRDIGLEAPARRTGRARQAVAPPRHAR